jgi:cyclophilin family peptidyl-prolyl cis-trans isomerase
MTFSNPLPLFKLVFSILVVCIFSACGGGNSLPPVVTGVKVQLASYSKTATIYFGGKNLRANLNIDTSGACINPTFASNSTTETLVFNCLVVKTGEFPIVVLNNQSQAIYQTQLTIPMPQVALITSNGSITVELDPTLAPLSTNNFLSYVSNGFYRSTLFHRVIPNFIVQGGGFTSGMVKKIGQSAAIELESNKGLSNVRGSLAMARTNLPNSATSEFYINLANNLSLDYESAANPGYAVFGRVIQGMDVVDALAAESTGVVGGLSDVPLADITLSIALQTK